MKDRHFQSYPFKSCPFWSPQRWKFGHVMPSSSWFHALISFRDMETDISELPRPSYCCITRSPGTFLCCCNTWFLIPWTTFMWELVQIFFFSWWINLILKTYLLAFRPQLKWMHNSYQSSDYTYTESTFGLGEGGDTTAHETRLARWIQSGVSSSSSPQAGSTDWPGSLGGWKIASYSSEQAVRSAWRLS